MPEVKDPTDGVQIDLISGEEMNGRTTMEKIRHILDEVREDKIVILEGGLSPDEEQKLIEVTMTEISPDGFSGIEIESYPQGQQTDPGIFDRIMGKTASERPLIIGPANQVETLRRDNNVISALVSRK